jgi:ubiquinone/menaquinone biosynthesis C-methylase UbiE
MDMDAGEAKALRSASLEKAVANVAGDWKNAAYYDEAEQGMERRWSGMIWPFIRDCEFDQVIDLACGHGRNTAKLAAISKHVYAVDVVEENITFCADRFRETANVTVVKNDGTSFPGISAGQISLVYCFDAMVHFDSDVVRAYLGEFSRVLKPGGKAFLHHSAMDARPTTSFRDSPGWRNFMTPALMAHWAHKEGLVVERQQPFDWRPEIQDCFTLLKKPK